MPRVELGTILVTGGASGLGAAVADAVFQHGGRPVVLEAMVDPHGRLRRERAVHPAMREKSRRGQHPQ